MKPISGALERHEQREEASFDRLLVAARELLASSGYMPTSLERVAERAGVTKGSLYHHFQNKRELFEAVFETEVRHLTERAAQALGTATTPWEAVFAGVSAFLDAAQDPAVQRIAFQDAPSVLGWERTREIDRAYGLALVGAALEALVANGEIEVADIETMSHLVFGSLIEAALLLHAKQAAPDARTSLEHDLRALLTGLQRR